ncbi:ATP-binding protein [Wukongibacter baidiensis]|uniref:HAMP domain-containing sensor histidine kinase n=1 Tax=Wukongibacter baidiensis TaxID=1723361 RepID=UPI003D7F354B
MSKNRSVFQIIYKFFQILFYILKILIGIIPAVFKSLGFILKLIRQMFSSLGRGFKKLLRFSLTFKITFVYGIIISIILFLSSLSILFGFRFFIDYDSKKDIEKSKDIILSQMQKDLEIPHDSIDSIAKFENITIAVFDKNKDVIYPSENNIKFHGAFSSPTFMRSNGKDILVLSDEINLTEGTLYLQLSKDLTTENTLLYTLFIILLIVNIIGLIIIVAIGFRISKRMLSPIKDMTERVNAITVENLDTRLDVGGAYDELRDLAVTFNEMFDKIQSSYEKQNQFVSDASHELRTPISVIQGYINLLDRWGKGDKEVLDESIVAIKGESEAMKDLIEKLLFLARSDKNLLNLQREDFYINELIDEIIYETKLIDSSHTIIGETNENITFNADRKLLKQALRIFIDNSVKFTPKGGTIKVLSTLQKRQLLLVVEDTGMGIPKEDIDHVFNRFYRSDKSRTKETGGHGLGLSIAKLIIDEHGGHLKVESTVDVGTKIKVFLPIKKTW